MSEVLEPGEDWVRVCDASEERAGHAVDGAGGGGLGGVDVGVGVDPDDVHAAIETLSDSTGNAGDGSDGDGVVPAEGECETAFFCVGVDLGGEFLGDSGDGEGVSHVELGRVVFGEDVSVGVDGVVIVDGVAKGPFEIIDEAGFDEEVRGYVDTGFSLEKVLVRPSEIVGGSLHKPVLQRSQQRRYRAGPLRGGSWG